MSTISHIRAREILDSRGNPTIETTVVLASGASGTASVPSGASTGTHEAVELRDGGKRYGGKGVQKAVKHVEGVIARALIGKDIRFHRQLDHIMISLDGTPTKKRIGANAILSVSLASMRALAEFERRPLYMTIRKAYGIREKKWRMPILGMNILNGGRHADNGLSVQEFMIFPKHRLLRERVRMGVEVFSALHTLLLEKKYSTGVGDEGGFAPELQTNEAAIRYILLAIRRAGYEPGKHVTLGLDVAASEFFRNGKYYLHSNKQGISAKEVVTTLKKWVRTYPLVSIEDGLSEDDWDGWRHLTDVLAEDALLVGDDIFVTNPLRIKQGIEKGIATSVLIKPNQIGSLSETIDAVQLVKKHGYAVFMSHRSGETADTFIADLSVAVHAEFLKTGSLSRSERVEKYNRLMQIESEIS